ncbi:MAG: hypothetical protein WC869_01025 [Phycisphaerae bacterium]|jgi:hypothetical protein
MKLRPEAVEAAVIESWKHMKRDDPVWEFNLTAKRFPEAVDAHRTMVTAMLETGCDPYKAVLRATGGKMGFDDLWDSGKKWNKALADYLKAWAVKHGLT